MLSILDDLDLLTKYIRLDETKPLAGGTIIRYGQG
jgi:hypothetical protein